MANNEQQCVDEDIRKKASEYARRNCPNPDIRYFYEQAYISGAIEMASQGWILLSVLPMGGGKFLLQVCQILVMSMRKRLMNAGNVYITNIKTSDMRT